MRKRGSIPALSIEAAFHRACHLGTHEVHHPAEAARRRTAYAVLEEDRTIGRGRSRQDRCRTLRGVCSERREELSSACRTEEMREIELGGIRLPAEPRRQVRPVVVREFGRHERGGIGIVAQTHDLRAGAGVGKPAAADRLLDPGHAVVRSVSAQCVQPGAVRELEQSRRAGGIGVRARIEARFQPGLRHQVLEIDPRCLRRARDRGARAIPLCTALPPAPTIPALVTCASLNVKLPFRLVREPFRKARASFGKARAGWRFTGGLRRGRPRARSSHRPGRAAARRSAY